MGRLKRINPAHGRHRRDRARRAVARPADLARPRAVLLDRAARLARRRSRCSRVGAVLLRRSQRSWTTLDDLRTGVRPPPWLIGFPIAAFVLFIFGASLSGPLVQRAIVKHTTYEPIAGLPAGGKVRLVPREVAEQNASSAFNSPTETLTDFRIVNTRRRPGAGPRCARRRASSASSPRRARASSSSTPSRPPARCARSTPS